jgi:LPS export ABC transporter protein LptC
MKIAVTFLYSIIVFFIISCTFDYGETEASERETPDLVMENVEYVRVRAADPVARFHAQRAERYEKQGVMRLQNFTFEQFGEKGQEVNAFGNAGSASIDIESGDIFMHNGVRLEVESEDIILETPQLEWKDEARILTSGRDDEVRIMQTSGTSFTGIGLRVEARIRTWEFSGAVTGTFIPDDDEEESDEAREQRRIEREQRIAERELREREQREQIAQKEEIVEVYFDAEVK